MSFGTSHGEIPRGWLLLDSCSTVDVFCNQSFLSGIHTTKRNMTLKCNAGTSVTNKQGYSGDYPLPVWYDQSGIANILSLHNVSNHCRIQYDNLTDGVMIVTTPSGQKHIFLPSAEGLFHLDLSNRGLTWAMLNTIIDANGQMGQSSTILQDQVTES